MRRAELGDARLPGLSLALDPGALAELLARHLPECRRGAEVLEARVDDVQYTPGESATVLVNLKLRGGEYGRTARQRVYVKALPPGVPPAAVSAEVLERYAALRLRRATRRASPLELPVLPLPEHGLCLYAYPVDPVLTALSLAADPEAMKQALHRVWHPRRARVRRVSAEALSYTPESRAALRYEVLVEDKDTGLPELRRLVGKVQMRKSPARLFAGHWAVWKRTFARARIAPPVGYIATAQLSLQEFVDGTRLSDLAGSGELLPRARQAARALAVVHGELLPVLSQRGVEKEVRSVRRWGDVLAAVRPDLADRLHRLQERLASELSARMRVSATVHADFHLANALAHGDGVTLIDWDQIAHGDPMVDAGRFLGSLRVSSLRAAGDPHALTGVGEAFLEAYLRASGEDERRARLFESAALIVAAATPFRLQRAGWEQAAESLVLEAERALESSLHGPRVPAAPPAEKRRVPEADRVAWALDPNYARALLAPLVRGAHGEDLEPTECESTLLAHDDELLHLRWDLKGYRGRERWRARVVGIGVAGHTGTSLLRRLSALFAAASGQPGALLLPHPLGQLEPLALVAVEPPRGEPLERLLGTPEEEPALAALARGLAHLAGLEVALDKRRTGERELCSVEHRCARLEVGGHAAAARTAAVLLRLRERLEALQAGLVPSLHGLRLRDLVVLEGAVGAWLVRDVVAAPAHALAGQLCAQLVSSALRRREREPLAARALRRAYCEAAGAAECEVAPFEALALVRRATGRALERTEDAHVHALLARAELVLGAGA